MERRVVIIYRISETGYLKEKPPYINNRQCLLNAFKYLDSTYTSWIIIGDNLSKSTLRLINETIPKAHLIEVEVGHGAGTFNLALDQALSSAVPDNAIVYFLENDYLHREGSLEVLREGIELGSSFVTLYDHPDKYLDKNQGGNPLCKDGGEVTVVFRTKSTHWKYTNSTTMTFAGLKTTLADCEETLRKYTVGSYPEDFLMFLKLREEGASLISPIPGYSTHGETRWLSPGVDWEKFA